MTAPAPPRPPPDIDLREPLLGLIERDATLHRFYTKKHDPIYFDRSRDGRFNSPDKGYGTMYVAETRAGAFAETFLRKPGRTLIPRDLLDAKGYVRFKLKRAIVLVKLAGRGLARIGATAEVSHRSQPYDVPQAWSKALYGHPLKPSGIAYTARHDDEAMCIALFERARVALKEVERQTDLDQEWFWQLADTYGIGMPPS